MAMPRIKPQRLLNRSARKPAGRLLPLPAKLRAVFRNPTEVLLRLRPGDLRKDQKEAGVVDVLDGMTRDEQSREGPGLQCLRRCLSSAWEDSLRLHSPHS